MTTLVLVSLAAFMVFEWALAYLPRPPEILLAPVVVALAFGVQYLGPLLLPAAAAGAVVLLHHVLSPDYPAVKWPRLALRLPKIRRKAETRRVKRIPTL